MDATVKVDIELNWNEERPELWFYLTINGRPSILREPRHFYSVAGMTKRFPQHRQAIIDACQSLFARLPVEHHPRLERAIARA